LSTVLVIEGSAPERARIRAALDASQIFKRVLEAADGLEGLRLLVSEAVDVVVCDVDVPGFDGEKLLRMKESSPGGANTPFVYLTRPGHGEHRARILTLGAADAIQKPFHMPELVARLRLHLKVKRLQDELRLKNETLARLSTVDGLTGLRARRYLDEVLNLEFLRARRYRTDLSVIMMDVDHFKRINDVHGHVAGDMVLRGLSEILRSMLRSTDVAGRFGGEEFMVVLPRSRLDGATVFAERVREATQKARFGIPDGEVEATLSLGVAQYQRDQTSAQDLVALADRALYGAKSAGRNRVMTA
jgi:diguanylate cyclase (GGDEF)-like protein